MVLGEMQLIDVNVQALAKYSATAQPLTLGQGQEHIPPTSLDNITSFTFCLYCHGRSFRPFRARSKAFCYTQIRPGAWPVYYQFGETNSERDTYCAWHILPW